MKYVCFYQENLAAIMQVISCLFKSIILTNHHQPSEIRLIATDIYIRMTLNDCLMPESGLIGGRGLGGRNLVYWVFSTNQLCFVRWQGDGWQECDQAPVSHSLAHTWQMTLICINKSHGSPVTKHMGLVCYDYTGYWLLATSFWRNEIYFEGYSWVPVAMYIIWYWMMAGAWYLLCYSAPNILLLSRLASPAGARVQFDDCLDLFLFCLHALILNSLALHAEWSKLWTRSEKGKRVKEKSHQALSLSPFTQWLNLY